MREGALCVKDVDRAISLTRKVCFSLHFPAFTYTNARQGSTKEAQQALPERLGNAMVVANPKPRDISLSLSVSNETARPRKRNSRRR